MSVKQEENVQKPKNKKKKVLLIVLISFVVLIGIVLGVVYYLYSNYVNVADRYEDKFLYTVSQIDDSKEYKVDDFINYDYENDPDNIQISIPCEYVLTKALDIKNLCNNLSENYEVDVNRIGIENGNEANSFNYYVEVSYKRKINSIVKGVINYEITQNNSIKIYSKDIDVGDNIPKSLYDSYIELPIDKLISEIKPSEIKLLSDNTLDLSQISNIEFKEGNFEFKYNYLSNIDGILKYIVGDNKVYENNVIKFVQTALINAFSNR